MSLLTRRRFLMSSGALIAIGNAAGAQPMPGMSGSQAMPVAPSVAPAATTKRILTLPEGQELRPLVKLASKINRPGIFSATVTAAPATIEFVRGTKTEMLAYNGMIPGPLIEVTEGDHVEIEFVNHLDSDESTIHWHGMPVPPDQDGNPMNVVPIGDKRSYVFTLPEDSAGSFWYHPHASKHTPEQVFRGLAGPFIVKPKIDPLPKGLGATTLFISDLRIDADGSISPNTDTDWFNGREGDHILVNGQKRPNLTLNPGASHRFRIYNVSNGRYLRLAFQDHDMTLIGTDGGLLGAPVRGLKEILLAPAERTEVVVDFRGAAGHVSLENLPYDRGWMGDGKPPSATTPVLTVSLTGETRSPTPLPAKLRDIVDLGTATSRKKLVFGEKMSELAKGGMSVEFLIDGKSFEIGRVDLTSRLREVELWEIANPTDMDHPFHLHGTQFQVVERETKGNVVTAPFLSWKDTVNVARGESVRFKVRQDMPGLRMYHCHILEHEEKGMQGILKVF